jgi:hypothetical protein
LRRACSDLATTRLALLKHEPKLMVPRAMPLAGIQGAAPLAGLRGGALTFLAHPNVASARVRRDTAARLLGDWL